MPPLPPNQITIDLSAGGGLAPKFWGDSDQTVSDPSTRYFNELNAYAEGFFNPWMRNGFTSPAIATLGTTTTDNAFAAVLGSTVYDAINDDVYFAERGLQVFHLDGQDDTSFTRDINLSNAVVHDLEIYQVNGVRKLFYVHTGGETVGALTLSTTLSGSVFWFSRGFVVNPAGAAFPSFVLADGNAKAGASTTNSHDITFPNVTYSNPVVVVIVGQDNSSGGADVTGVQFQSNAMTSAGSSTVSGAGISMKWSLWYYVGAAIISGTRSVDVAYSGSTANRFMQTLVFNGASQVTPITLGAGATGTGTTAAASVTTTAAYQLPVQPVVSASGTQTPTTSIQVAAASATFTSVDVFGASYSLSPILKVGISDLPVANTNNDWLTSTTAGAFINSTLSNYNFLRVADNGFAYLFADNTVNKIDGTTSGGTNGTVSPNVLLFPPYFRICDALDYRGLMFIGIHQTTLDPTTAAGTGLNLNTPCGIYVWDRQTSIVNTRDYIQLTGVKAIKKLYVSPDGQLRLITIASNGLTQIREYDGTKFSIIKELGLGASPQYPDSLVTSTSHSFWLANDGTIYGHGKINPDDTEILAKVGYIKAPSSSPATNLTATGALHYGSASTFSAASGYRADRQGLTIAYNDGGSFAAIKFYPFDKGTINSNNQTSLAGNAYTGVYHPFEVVGYAHHPNTMSTINFIDVLMIAGSSGGSTVQGTVSIYFNGSSTAWAAKDVTRDDIVKGYKRIEVNKPYVHSVQLKISYATGIVLSDTYDFHPKHAVVHFTPTNMKG